MSDLKEAHDEDHGGDLRHQDPAGVEARLRKLPAEERECYWFEHVYQGDDAPQLTFRAVAMGAALGGFMALSNLYIGLKTGWGLGVAITAFRLGLRCFQVMASRRLRMLLGG